MSDKEFNLEAELEVVREKLRKITLEFIKVKDELMKYKMIEHANCGCTNFCYEKKNAENYKELYDDLNKKYQEMKNGLQK